jgi:antitoxin ParD1/3/4
LTKIANLWWISAMATMNISLPDQMKSYIEDQVASGLYANASDFVRDLIRDRVAKRDALLAALGSGLID